MAETESLRPVIADILDGLVSIRPYPAWRDIAHGADTLRWAHEHESAPTGDELLELERLRALVEGIEDVLGETTKTGKPIHPGAAYRRVVALVRDADV